jgi:uncharacterized protein (TIGR02145 family)
MNNLFKIIFFILLGIPIFLPSCKKQEDEIPLVNITMVPVYNITRTSAYIKASLVNEGTDTVISYGFCWSTKPQPTYTDNRIVATHMQSGNSINGTYFDQIRNLSPNTTCYVKAYAITAKSKIYGNQETFTTKPATAQTTFNQNLTYQSVSDIDGNNYKTIKIGTQQWLAENLKTTRLNDGTAIPLVTEDNKWAQMNTAAYCWYFNDESVFKNIYGGYYNWYAINTGKLCPSGWHVPTEDDWKVFKLFLGMRPDQLELEYFPETTAGNKIKETGTFNWDEENTEATNESGFTALPGGSREDGFDSASFDGEGEGGGWWSASVLNPYNEVLSHWVLSFTGTIFRSDMLRKNYGLNVRCVKD